MRVALDLKADPTSESKPLASIINGEELTLGTGGIWEFGGSVQIKHLGL